MTPCVIAPNDLIHPIHLKNCVHGDNSIYGDIEAEILKNAPHRLKDTSRPGSHTRVKKPTAGFRIISHCRLFQWTKGLCFLCAK